jgi:hypothetical protein
MELLDMKTFCQVLQRYSPNFLLSISAISGKLIEAETRARGMIKWQTYLSYAKAGGGFVVCFFVLLMFFIQIACTGLGNWWLSYWLTQGSGVSSL